MGRRVSDLFDIEYGQSLALNALVQLNTNSGAIAFVSRTAKNNGVSAWVEPVPGVDPFPSGLMTVCLRSRNYSLTTFVQVRPFYCGYHIYVLRPKMPMEIAEKLWWAQCIRANRYRYNFGRQANTSFANLILPESPPAWVRTVQIPELAGGSGEPVDSPMLMDRHWLPFRMSEIFELQRGRRFLRRDISPGTTPYIRATATNNGVSQFTDMPALFAGRAITVASNGSVGEAFYQPAPFVASDDVVVLRPRVKVPEACCLFLCTIIWNERYRFSYGRKWFTARMQAHVLNLPASADGNPDWEFMSRFMMSFPLATAVFPARPTG